VANNQSLVGSVVIGAELDRKDHGSIPAIAIGMELKSLDGRTDPQTKFNWRWKKKSWQTVVIRIF
jgi:hypothetical protein